MRTMWRFLFFSILAVTLVLFVSSCASIGVSARYTPVMGITKWPTTEGSGKSVVVLPFEDGRSSEILGKGGTYGTNPIKTTRDIPRMFSLAVHDALQRCGLAATLADSSRGATTHLDETPCSVRGTVLRYDISIDSHFASVTVFGHAQFTVVVAEGGHERYRSEYSGEASLKASAIPWDAVAGVLDEALQNAIASMSHDEKMQLALTSR